MVGNGLPCTVLSSAPRQVGRPLRKETVPARLVRTRRDLIGNHKLSAFFTESAKYFSFHLWTARPESLNFPGISKYTVKEPFITIPDHGHLSHNLHSINTGPFRVHRLSNPGYAITAMQPCPLHSIGDQPIQTVLRLSTMYQVVKGIDGRKPEFGDQ